MGGASGCHTGTYYIGGVPDSNLYLVVVDNYAINSACDPEEPQVRARACVSVCLCVCVCVCAFVCVCLLIV